MIVGTELGTSFETVEIGHRRDGLTIPRKIMLRNRANLNAFGGKDMVYVGISNRLNLRVGTTTRMSICPMMRRIFEQPCAFQTFLFSWSNTRKKSDFTSSSVQTILLFSISAKELYARSLCAAGVFRIIL